MITFLNILISSSIIPISDLVSSHNSSCDVPISTSPVPKSHIDMSVIGHGIGGKVIPAKMARLAESQSLEQTATVRPRHPIS